MSTKNDNIHSVTQEDHRENQKSDGCTTVENTELYVIDMIHGKVNKAGWSGLTSVTSMDSIIMSQFQN